MFKQYLPTSLFGRTFLIVMLPVLLLQIAVSIVFFDRHWSKMTERLTYAVVGEMMAIVDKYQQDPSSFSDIQKMFRETLNLEVVLEQGDFDSYSRTHKPFFSIDSGIYRDLSREIEKATSLPYHIDVQTIDKKIFVRFLVDGTIVLFTVPERRLFSSSSYIFILWVMGLSLLLFTIAMIFMRNQIRPIYRLGIIAERLGRGIPVGHIKPSGAREVRQTAQAFAKMQDRINQYIDQRTTMLAGVSHDLRTPLTRMKLQLEMMDENADTQAMRDDIHDMEQMIEGYLSFAKGDGGEDMHRMLLADILDKVIDDGKRLGLSIQSDAKGYEGLMIWAKPQALSRAFMNFISNAARYATTLHIMVEKQDDLLFLTFEDNGSGIPQDKMTDMLKPFVRGDDSRNKKTGGVGLGLTIAHDIIASHGGQIVLQKSDAMGGLKAIVTLPL